MGKTSASPETIRPATGRDTAAVAPSPARGLSADRRTSWAEPLEPRQLFAAVAGTVFDDANGDGVRQAAERGVAGRRVYADLNADGRRDANEPSTSTNGRGTYRLAGLPAGKTVVVRQELPDASEQTSPTAGGASGAYHVGRAAKAGLKINVIPGPALKANKAAVAQVRAAAAMWSKYLATDVTLNVDVELTDLGPASTLGSTTTTHAVVPYGQLRDALVARATPDDAFVRDLPASADALNYVLSPGGEGVNPYHFDGSMLVGRANLLALGWSPDALDAPPSAFDSAVTKVDAFTSLNSAAAFDFNPADGVAAGKTDFYSTVLHELGHALGFESGVDFVDFYRDNDFVDREVQPSALDLFRLKPGGGAAGFATADRVWAAGRDVPAQVLYDGGRFDPTGVVLTGVGGKPVTLSKGDIPMSTGVVAGDGTQPSHWKDDRDDGGRFLGIMDPSIDAPFTAPAATDLRAMQLIGWDVRQPLAGRTVQPATAAATVGGQDFGVRLGDADDQLSEAKPVVPNAKPLITNLYRPADVDVYSLRGKQGDRYGINVRDLREVDASLRVFDADGVQLATNTGGSAPGGAGRGSYVNFVLPRDGTYYFSVSATGNARFDPVGGGGDVDGNSKGYYSLCVVDRTGDGNNQIATAAALPLGAAVDGYIAPTDDVDLYRVTVKAGQRLHFDTDRPADSGFDPLLRLFDADGNELAWTGRNYNPSAAADGGKATLEYRFRQPGTYYLGVSANGNVSYDPLTGTNRADGPGGAYTLSAGLFASRADALLGENVVG